jgi:hypothetical protein
MVAARDISADRKPDYWWLTEMSLLTGPPDSTGGCRSALVDNFGVSPSECNHPWSTLQSPGDEQKPVEAAVLRRQSHPIMANLPPALTISNCAFCPLFP